MHRSRLNGLGVFVGAMLFTGAQAQTFQAVYTGTTELSHDIVATRDCGFQTIGRGSPGGLVSHAITSRISATGKVIWANRYFPALTTTSYGYSVLQSLHNNDLLFGCDFGNSLVGTRFVFRTDEFGVPLWGVRMSGSFSNVSLGQGGGYGFVPVSIAELNNGNIAVSSRETNANGVVRLGLLALLQSDGTVVFSKRYVPGGGGTAAADFVQVREARDPEPTKELLVLGTILFSADFYGVLVLRTDSSGDVLWAHTYLHPDGTSNLIGTGFALAANGDICFAASRESKPLAPTSSRNAVVGRIDSATGAPIWTKTFDGMRTSFGSVTVDPAGNVLATGFIGSSVDTAAAVVRFDSGGAFIDGKSYGDQLPNARAAGDAIIPLPETDGYAICGRTQEVAVGQSASLIRTDVNLSSGCHEVKYTPDVSDLEVVVRTPTLTVLDDPGHHPEMPEYEPFESLPLYRCSTDPCLGDLNADGFVDDADFVIFADAYNLLVCPTDATSGCCPADLSGDGFVDDFDFVLFAGAYDQLICPS